MQLVCDDGSTDGTAEVFQSSTRQTDFATGGLQERLVVPLGVSILYEADRLCNLSQRLEGAARAKVSILYEADRLCNCPCQEAAPDRGS